jgi:hypothetical protein
MWPKVKARRRANVPGGGKGRMVPMHEQDKPSPEDSGDLADDIQRLDDLIAETSTAKPEERDGLRADRDALKEEWRDPDTHEEGGEA